MKGSVSVFERYAFPQGPSPVRTAWRRLRALKLTFSTAVAASVAAHLAAGLTLILVPASLGRHERETPAAALERAVESVVDERPGDPEMEAFLAEAGQSGFLAGYLREQRRIYEFLVGRGGEDRDRGLFALGCFDWDLERFDLAVRSWMEVRPSFANPAFVKIRGVLSGADHHDIKMMRIQNILAWEDLRGSDEFLLRLVKFGKWKLRGG